MAYISMKRQPRRLAALLLAGTCLSPVGTSAQTWVGATGDYNTTSNWNPATVPTGSATTATFANTGVTSISLNNIGAVAIGTFQFDNNAQPYAFDVSGNTTLQFRDAGIVNNSAASQTINASGTGSVQFRASSSLGNATFNLNGLTIILDGAGVTGGSATINTNDDVNLGTNANLQNATVNLTGGGRLRFLDGTATGGQASVNMSSASSEIRFLNYGGTGTTIGSLAGSGQVFLTDVGTSVNQALTIGGNNQSTVFGGRIRDGGSIVKEGFGTLTLSGNSDYSGGTTLNAGILGVGHDNALGTGGLLMAGGRLQASASVTLGNAMTLNGVNVIDTQGNTLTLNGEIDGTGPLIKEGTGTLVLASPNIYSGGTTINEGILTVSRSSALGTGGLSIADGATLQAAASLTLSNAITLTGDTTIDTQTNTLRLDSAIGGTGALIKSGAGTLILDGTNTYVSGTTINGGTIAVSNASALGTGTVSLSGGNLTGVVNVTLANDITFTAGAGVIAAATGTTMTLAPNALSFSLIPNTVMTFGSGADAGTVVYSAGTSFITNVAFSTVVGGGTLRAGAATFGSLTGNAQATTVVNAGATLDFNDFSSTVTNLQGGGSVVTGVGGGTVLTVGGGNFSGVISGAGQLLKSGSGTLVLSATNTYSGGTTVSGGILGGTTSSLQGNILNNATVGFEQSGTGIYAGVMSGGGSLLKLGSGTVVLTGANTYTGGTTVSGGVLQGNTTSLQGNILNNASVVFNQTGVGTYAGTMSGTGMLTKTGNGQLVLTGANSYSGGTLVSAGVLQGTTSSLQGTIVNNAQVTIQQATTGTYAGNMSGTGSLLVNGTGTVILTGTNSYTGGTSLAANGGALQGNSASLQGNILNNASVIFNQSGSGTYAGAMSGSGGMTLQGGGILAMTGTSTYAGPTTVNASTLIVNGSLASTVILNNASMLGGAGTIGGLVATGATLSPGNSIGTMTVTGNFGQSGGTYVVEANAAGQSDRVNVGGTATINGANVQLIAAPGSYGTSTTYTILNATGGVGGTYTGVTSNFAFLTPSLSYNASNVFLTLALQGNAFSGFGGNTANQRGVGYALDQSYATATGDFATVIGALAGLTTTQAGPALNAISGQPYADLGSFNVAANAMFMNALGQQMALARGGRGSGQRQALAEACDIATCDGTSPFSVWVSALGGLGSVQGNGNSSTFTYNVGGTAAGIDYRLTPSVLVGVSAGYSSGTQWVDSFQGKGWSNTVSVAAYASFTQSAFYLDALAGYAYSNNQMQRQISVPNLQPRTANGSTGANQFLAQAEAGYAIPVYEPAQATVTPFARFQASSINQAAFNEWGANSLSLNVAQQTTTSVRTTLGADLAGAIGLGDTRTIDVGLRLGWLHEYADTARPVTAAFAGAPSASFTVYGATPRRDAAVIGFQASTNIAAATQLYLRYDGEIAAGADNHTLNVGLRLSW